MNQPYITDYPLPELARILAHSLKRGSATFKVGRYTLLVGPTPLGPHWLAADRQLLEISLDPDKQAELQQLVEYEETRMHLAKMQPLGYRIQGCVTGRWK